MKREGRSLLVVSLLTLLLTLMIVRVSLTQQSCYGNLCLTTATGPCRHFFPLPLCLPDSDQWGNRDECVHPLIIPLLCWEKSRTRDVWLFQCTAPPPRGAVGLHNQWMEIREYYCGTQCLALFVTPKKPAVSPEVE